MNVRFTYNHALTLHNHDIVIVDAQLYVDAFNNLFGPKQTHQAEVSALADATLNRWALELKDAGIVKTKEAYSTIERLLLNLRSSRFSVREVIVISVASIIQETPASEPSKLEQIKQNLQARTDTLEGFMQALAESKQTHPDIWADPDYAQLLQDYADTTIRSVFGAIPDYRRVKWTTT